MTHMAERRIRNSESASANCQSIVFFLTTQLYVCTNDNKTKICISYTTKHVIHYIVQRWSSQLPTYKHGDRNSSKYKKEYSHTYLLRQERNNLSTDGVQPLGDLRLSMQTHRQRQQMIIERPLNRHFIPSPPTKAPPRISHTTSLVSCPSRDRDAIRFPLTLSAVTDTEDRSQRRHKGQTCRQRTCHDKNCRRETG